MWQPTMIKSSLLKVKRVNLRHLGYMLAAWILPVAMAAPATINANGKNNPTDILKGGFCGAGTNPTGLLTLLTSGGLIAILFAVTLAIFGWNMKFGNRNAMESLKRSMIGMVVVLGASTIAGLFISGGC